MTWRQRIQAVIPIFSISIIIVVIDIILVGAYFLATGDNGNLATMISNVIFFEGVLILLAGVFIEFFHIGGRESTMIVTPKVLFPAGGDQGDRRSETVTIKHPGWLLIFLSGLMIVYSAAFAILL